jgi:hypothetical protein
VAAERLARKQKSAQMLLWKAKKPLARLQSFGDKGPRHQLRELVPIKQIRALFPTRLSKCIDPRDEQLKELSSGIDESPAPYTLICPPLPLAVA